MKCDRCKKDANPHIMSMFNEDIICMDCKNREVAHPLYKQALTTESNHVRNGNYNFLGIGLPADLI